jgi:hypothetical protein
MLLIHAGRRYRSRFVVFQATHMPTATGPCFPSFLQPFVVKPSPRCAPLAQVCWAESNRYAFRSPACQHKTYLLSRNVQPGAPLMRQPSYSQPRAVAG